WSIYAVLATRSALAVAQGAAARPLLDGSGELLEQRAQRLHLLRAEPRRPPRLGGRGDAPDLGGPHLAFGAEADALDHAVIRIREPLDHPHPLEIIDHIADGLLRQPDLGDEVRKPDTLRDDRGQDLDLRRSQRRKAEALEATRQLRLEIVLR